VAVEPQWVVAPQQDAVQNGWATQHNYATQLPTPVTLPEILIAGSVINKM